MKKMFWVAMLFVMCVATSYGQYNGECWVVSGGDTVYKLHANGNADPTVIPNLAQASAAEVNPTNGVAWIAISASNAVYRYDQAAQPPDEPFTQAPDIERPNMISVNPADGTVWVAWLHGVSKLSSDGKQILAQVVPEGGPPNVETGRFNVAVNPKDGSIWIADARGPINRYDANGTQIATGPTMPDPESGVPIPVMREPKGGISVDYAGNAWVADSQFNTLIRISPTGQELVKLTITSPVSPRVSPKDGSVWVVSEQSMLLNLSADGTRRHEFPAGMAVVGISLSPADDGIWVADLLGATFSGEVSKFSTNGTKLFANPIPRPSSVSVGFWEGN